LLVQAFSNDPNPFSVLDDRLLSGFCLRYHGNHQFMGEAEFGFIDATAHILDAHRVIKEIFGEVGLEVLFEFRLKGTTEEDRSDLGPLRK